MDRIPILFFNCPLGGCSGTFIQKVYEDQSSSLGNLTYEDYNNPNLNVKVEFQNISGPTDMFGNQYKIWFHYPSPYTPLVEAGLLTVTDVTPLFNGTHIEIDPQCQNGESYSGNLYDSHPNGATIGAAGCALTTGSMFLNLYGSGGENPGTLNTYLINNNGYTSQAGIRWDGIVRRSNGAIKELVKIGKGLKYFSDNKYIDITTSESNKINLSQLDSFLQKGIPVIVQVANYYPHIDKYRPHFVIVNGKDPSLTGPSAYYIVDPADCNSSNNTLSKYYNGNIYSIVYAITD